MFIRILSPSFPKKCLVLIIVSTLIILNQISCSPVSLQEFNKIICSSIYNVFYISAVTLNSLKYWLPTSNLYCVTKVGDFGLARWQPDGDLGVETRVIGTFG